MPSAIAGAAMLGSMSIEQVLSSRFFFVSLPDGVSSNSFWFSSMNLIK